PAHSACVAACAWIWRQAIRSPQQRGRRAGPDGRAPGESVHRAFVFVTRDLRAPPRARRDRLPIFDAASIKSYSILIARYKLYLYSMDSQMRVTGPSLTSSTIIS